MVTDLNRLAECLEQAAPDYRMRKALRDEQELIRQSLATVGEYVISDGERIYVIRAAGWERK